RPQRRLGSPPATPGTPRQAHHARHTRHGPAPVPVAGRLRPARRAPAASGHPHNPAGPASVSGAGPDPRRRQPPLPKAIPSSERYAIRLTGDGAATMVPRMSSGTWPTGIAMSVTGATVGE